MSCWRSLVGLAVTFLCSDGGLAGFRAVRGAEEEEEVGSPPLAPFHLSLSASPRCLHFAHVQIDWNSLTVYPSSTVRPFARNLFTIPLTFFLHLNSDTT